MSGASVAAGSIRLTTHSRVDHQPKMDLELRRLSDLYEQFVVYFNATR